MTHFGFIIAILIFIFGSAEICHSCDADWKERSGFCYYKSNDKASWNKAASNCNVAGGRLVSMVDLSERDYVYQTFIEYTGEKFWIGLNDITQEGMMEWSNEDFYFDPMIADWKLDQPDNGKGTGDGLNEEDCVAVNDESGNSRSQGTWDDNQCSKSRKYICKKEDNIVPDCDEDAGFVKMGSYCYRLVEDEYGWEYAEQQCKDIWNAELTAITSQEENINIVALMKTVNKDSWIGLSDIYSPGTLRWSNNHDELLYTNWGSGEPLEKPPGSACVQTTITTNGQWNEADCNKMKPFICRKGLRAVCPDGWIYGQGKCYEVVLNSNFFLSWSSAYQYCTAKNARMLEIKTEEDQHFIASLASEMSKEGIAEIWLGISDIGHDQTLTWADQTAIVYQQWDSSHNPRKGQDDCAMFYNGKSTGNWELTTCFSQQAFICEVTEGTPLSNLEVPDGIYYQCPTGWKLDPPFCFYFGETQMQWQAAENFCVKMNSHLASIHNERQQSFISAHITGQSWFGANDRIIEGTFQYTDNTNFNFTNWESGEPNGGTSANCLHTLVKGTWNDETCTESQNFICKAKAVQLTNPQPLPTLPPDANDIICGSDGYIHNPSTHKCYKIVDEISRTWADARLHCVKEGGDLASVNSPEEQSFIEVSIALSANQIAMWIGAEDSKNGPINAPVVDISDGGWRWSDGSPFNFINWNGGEPNNVNDEDCIEMQVSGGKWNDLKCSDYRGFVCEREDPDHTTIAPSADCNGVDCCYRHLGVEKGGSVTNRQLSASSQMDSASGPERGRLNTHDQWIGIFGSDIGPGKGGWIPMQNQPETQWIQVDLQGFYEVRGVVTQGLNGISQPVNQNMWTKQISVMYKTHKSKDVWEPVRDGKGNTIIFDANHDQNTQVTNIFSRPVMATGIRIYTEQCRLGCALRFEVLGCMPQCAGSLAVGDDNFNALTDSSFSASSSMSGFGPEMGKLDYLESISAVGCWKPATNDKNQWIQVNLGQLRKIAGILMQGNPSASEWVTDYYVQFSSDGSSFATYLNTNGNYQLFPGNENKNSINEGFLREPISTQFVRILPQTWNAAIAVRLDVIGCDNADLVTCSDTATNRPDSFTADCPAGCDSTTAAVYGTNVYAETSSICLAAVHDGRILADHGGTVDVNMIDGKDGYSGSFAYGITSQDYGQADRSFIFQGDHLGCPNGWHGWLDWCYYTPRHSPELNWADARSYCQTQGGDLASIHSQAEQDFVSTLLFYQYTIRDAWVGMNDLDHLNYYQWCDGTDVTFTAWKPLEPNGDHERCVELFRETGRWNDRACDDTNNLVCKMDKYPVNQEQEVIDGCETGWIAFEGSCYFIDLTRMVWINSEDYCKGVGGHLVAINDIYEQMWLLSQIAEATHSSNDEKFWIGMGAYIDPNSDALMYQWSNGDPVTFTAWDKNQPDIRHTCSFPFLYEGVEYYKCIEEGWPYQLVGSWCSADPVFNRHFVACNGWSDSQVGCFRMDSISGLWSQGQPIACGSDAYKICEKSRVGYTNAPLPTTPSPTGNCPSGWYGSASSNYCYQINEMEPTSRLSWSEADIHCTSQGAQLASMHSYQEEAIIAQGVQHSSGNDFFWIGLKDIDLGTNTWTDGTPLTYTNWKASEPNNHNGRENCAEAQYSTDGALGWNDMNCDSAQNWICKILRGATLFPPVTVPPAQISYQCGEEVDWYSYTPGSLLENCYYFSTQPLSFYNANQQCQILGGTLVSIHSEDEQIFLTGMTSKMDVDSFWIGLVEDGLNGYYVWVDGSTLVFANWWGGEPNDHNGQETCTQMSNLYGLWNDDNCGRAYGYICKKLLGATPGPPKPTPPLPGGCPDGWSLYGSKCFLPVGWTDTSMRKTWSDAESYCKEQGGHLASVPNQYYNAFLVSLMYQAHSAVWIGLNTIGNNRVFLWSDNEDVSFTNWDVNEPNGVGTEDCVEMYTSGRWNDQGCEDVRPYICNTWRSEQYAEPSPDTTDCPAGYTRFDTSCYKLYSESADQKSWQDARDQCISDGKQFGMNIDLVSIWNYYENAYLKALFWPEVNYDYAWIGLYYNHSETNGETQFMWADGSALYYTNWETNQPQNTDSSIGCVEMRKYGTWSLVSSSGIGGGDDSCDTKRPFVCKYEELSFPTQSPGLGSCDPDWVSFGDYCYYVRPGFGTTLLSWGDAENACNSRGGNLVSIHSDIENKAIDTWAGSKTVWLGMKRNAWGGWDWSDYSPIDFTHWMDGEPNNYGESGEQCVELYQRGGWNDNTCSNSRGYVCKKHKSYSTCTFPEEDRVDCGYAGINEYECLERLCCWDSTGSAEVNCYYSRADAQCLDKGGQCKDYEHVTCELGYEQNLCSGGTKNRCCFTCAIDDDTCNGQVAGWNEGDAMCEDDSSVGGTCQYNTNFCSGTYLSGLCGGPGERQCCYKNSVPPATNPLVTNSPKSDGARTSLTPKTQTAPKTATTTKENLATQISGSSGLSGGAIAGIVITVVFLAAGVSLAFYFHRFGRLPSTSSFSFPKKGYGNESSSGGFDNPITYSKDLEDNDEVKFGSSSHA